MKRLDDLMLGGLKIYQESDLFSFGTDAVLLADFCRRKKYKKAVDLCTGNGVIPLLLSRENVSEIFGVEISEISSSLAKESVEYNRLSDRIKIINADLREIIKSEDILPWGAFDLVSVNPPYFRDGSGKEADGLKKIARSEKECTLEDVILSSEKLLKSGGRFCIINRSERLSEIFYLMKKHRIEPKVLTPVETAKDRRPTLVLVEGKKDGKEGLLYEKPINLFENFEYKNL